MAVVQMESLFSTPMTSFLENRCELRPARKNLLKWLIK